jgi:hypothetical protein
MLATGLFYFWFSIVKYNQSFQSKCCRIMVRLGGTGWQALLQPLVFERWLVGAANVPDSEGMGALA